MKLKLRLFAAAKEAVGKNELEIDIDREMTVAELRTLIANNHPTLESVLADSVIAVNGKYAVESDLVQADQEVALIPPVSGG